MLIRNAAISLAGGAQRSGQVETLTAADGGWDDRAGSDTRAIPEQARSTGQLRARLTASRRRLPLV